MASETPWWYRNPMEGWDMRIPAAASRASSVRRLQASRPSGVCPPRVTFWNRGNPAKALLVLRSMSFTRLVHFTHRQARRSRTWSSVIRPSRRSAS